MRNTIPGLAAELGWPVRRFRGAFSELSNAGLVEADERACYIGIPDFFDLNRPESPNVVKSWTGVVELLPECDLKDQLCHRLEELSEALGEAFARAFREALAKGQSGASVNQEQKQEQKRERRYEPPKEMKKLEEASTVGQVVPNGSDPLRRLRAVAVGALNDSERNPSLTEEQRAQLCQRVEAAATGPQIFGLYKRATGEALS